MLIIFSGLPGTGKTTISKRIAQELQAVYLRVDTVEQTLKTEGPEGYKICYAIAAENLKLGLTVVADSVNPIAITREAWRHVAKEAGTQFVEIALECSDKKIHKERVVSRKADILGHRLPTWEKVVTRDYEPWETKPLVIDTAKNSVDETVKIILDYLYH